LNICLERIGGIILRIPAYRVFEEVRPTGIPWNIQMVNAPSFWEKSKGNGRVVAVIDTGCQIDHPEFEGRIINPRNMVGSSKSADVTDKIGHGTHVCGIIAGKSTGVAPQARIMPFKVDTPSGFLDNLAIHNSFKEIIKWNETCTESDRVVAVNCSFGSSFYDAIMAYYIRMLTAEGVVVCVAAGNSGDGNPETHECFSYPAFIYEVVTVSSIAKDGKIAFYSNSFDGIDLAAPGTDIYSAWPGNTYKTISGTSMATPHVTGAVALLADVFYQREGRCSVEGEMDATVPHLKAAEGVLFKHIKPVPAGSSYLYGRGILDLTFNNNKWALNRVQVGAFYHPSGAQNLVKRINQAGFPAYRIKY
jgi:major intracellular serine protease